MVMLTTRPIYVFDAYDGEITCVHWQSQKDQRPWREWADMMIVGYEPGTRVVIGMPTPRKVLFHVRRIAFETMDFQRTHYDKVVNPYELMQDAIQDYHDWTWSKTGEDYLRQYNKRCSEREAKRRTA